MKRFLTATTALMALTGAVQAAGIERDGNDYSLLFKEGNHAQIGFNYVTPKVEGTYGAALGGGSTGNMAKTYGNLSFGVKQQLTDKLGLAFFYGQPYGADAEYTSGVYTGLKANWESNSASVILSYKPTDNITVYGGGRYLSSKASIEIPDPLIRGPIGQSAQQAAAGAAAAAAAGDATTAAALGARAQALGAVATSTTPLTYSASSSADGKLGYVIGAAYERPDIALRVGLTYESGVTHKLDTVENNPALGAVGAASVTEVKMPASLTLDFRTGVAKDTLVFGSVKWVEHSVWEVRTASYEQLTGEEVTGFDNDGVTYTLGLGRKINDNFSVFGRIGYEKAHGGVASRLAPTDGRKSIGIGGAYTMDNTTLRAGIEYAKLGDAVDSTGTRFEGSSALGIGMTVGFDF